MIVNSGQTENIKRTLERFLGHIPTLSKQKFSSNVIELVSFICRNMKIILAVECEANGE